MLSIYGRKLRPYHEIEKIISATEGFEEKSLKKWQKISTVDNEFIHIIVSGVVEFRRESDELFHFLSFVPYVWPGPLEYRGAFDSEKRFLSTDDRERLVA